VAGRLRAKRMIHIAFLRSGYADVSRSSVANERTREQFVFML
jgi:hypothetical protein